jgi:cobalt-zinc-cadmium efflux system outer membrane protein
LQATVENEVELAYLTYAGAKATLEKIETTMLAKARDVRSILEYSYKRGEAGFVDFLEAQRAYNDTMQTYNDSRADYAKALYTIDSATGSSVAGRGVSRP